MKRIKSILALAVIFAFVSSIGFAATSNIALTTKYLRLGPDQDIGKVRMVETEESIGSMEAGQTFDLFFTNAEFTETPPIITTQGRLTIQRISGGEDGDTYVTYELVDSGDTGRVWIDLHFANMDLTSYGDITLRADSRSAGVTSGYFSSDLTQGMDDDEEDEDDKDEEEVVEPEEKTAVVGYEKFQEAVRNNKNIKANGDGYSFVLSKKSLNKEVFAKNFKKNYNLKFYFTAEESSSKYLTDLYTLKMKIKTSKDTTFEVIKSLEENSIFVFDAKSIEKKYGVVGVLIKDKEEIILPTYYDPENDQYLVAINDFEGKLTLKKGSPKDKLIYFHGKSWASFSGVTKQLISKPFIYDNTNYLPVRETAEFLGWKVVWNPETRKVNIDKGEKVIVIDTANNNYLMANNKIFVSDKYVKELLGGVIFEYEDMIIIE